MDQNPPLHVAETRATRSSSAQKGRNKAPEQLPKKPMQKRKKRHLVVKGKFLNTGCIRNKNNFRLLYCENTQ